MKREMKMHTQELMKIEYPVSLAVFLLVVLLLLL